MKPKRTVVLGKPAPTVVGADSRAVVVHPKESKRAVRGAIRQALEAAGLKPEPAPEQQQQSFGFDVTHQFLGEEFLLWLWFRWEIDGGEFTLHRGLVVGVAIDDLIEFAPLSDDDTRQSLRFGVPTRTAEARQALRSGHRLAKARLLVATSLDQWTVVLDAGRWVFSGVRLPDDRLDNETAYDHSFERTQNWLELLTIMEELFAQFVRARIGKDWPKWCAEIAEWMAAGKKHKAKPAKDEKVPKGGRKARL
ncbi:MAG: hypothetical protein RJA36_790 [Pseudomonadota bacterium]|jgi:hypothetical protein